MPIANGDRDRGEAHRWIARVAAGGEIEFIAVPRANDVAPFTPGTVTATETVVTACGMIRAADLNMFDVAIWFHRPPGIE